MNIGTQIEASVTIDPSNGNVYVGAGDGDIYVVGLDKDGNALWSSMALLVFDYVEDSNNPQKAQSARCLSDDGSTYHFQTISEQGDGQLYAINTADGSVKWTYETHQGINLFYPISTWDLSFLQVVLHIHPPVMYTNL